MTDTTVKSFADFGVDERICDALAEAGITTPFPIQELTLPLALAGADVIGQARTGTGKTLGFGIPLLQRSDPADGRTQALVIVPTRELCQQVRGDLAQVGSRRDFNVVAVYGGKSIDAQIAAIGDGAPIVVGTPGRLLDLLRRGILDLSNVTSLVLDEADEMLDLGFLPDVEQLIEATAEQRQTLLFSATMPSAVVALARRYMHKPTFLRADVEEVRIAPETEQHFFSCHRMDKPAVLARILKSPDLGLCLVFTRTKRMADVLVVELRERGVKAAPIHSDLRQDARERALSRFRNGTIDVLVATEVAARGLDITDVTHVLNYDCPDDEKMYLHRIGRTGRAGAAGVAITLAVWNELARLEVIKKSLGIDAETPEVFSTSPLLDELFNLPPRDSTHPSRRRREAVADEPDEEAANTAPASRAGGPRQRRGGRGSRRSATAAPQPLTEPAREPTPATDTPIAADDGGSDAVRTRTRKRTVRRDGGGRRAAVSAQDVAATTTEEPTTEEPSSQATQPSTADTGEQATQPSTAGGDGEATATQRGQEQRSKRARRRGARGDRATRDVRRDDHGAGDRRRERPDRLGSTDRAREGDTRRSPARLDTTAVRGAGRPTLQRPLVIDHLP